MPASCAPLPPATITCAATPLSQLMHASHRARFAWGALALAAALTGCASAPEVGPRATLAQPDALSAAGSLSVLPAAEWPQQAWWARYGDPQLDALVAEALQGAPSLKEATARVDAAAAVQQQQGAAQRPTVQASAATTRERQSYHNGIPAGFVQPGWYNHGQAALELSWHLDWWGKDRAALAAATSELEASRADAALARLTLTTSLAQAWAELARLHDQQDTAQAALKVRTESLGLTQARQQQGLETQAEVRQAQAKAAQAQGDVLQIQEAIGLQHHLLAALVGAGPDRGLQLARPRLQLASGTGLPASLPASLVGRRPDLVSARLQAEAASARIDQAQAAFYPDINLRALVGVQAIGVDNLSLKDARYGSVGPAITLPLFDQGHLQGAFRQSHARQAEAVAHYQQVLSTALREVADAATSLSALDGRLAQAEAAASAAQDAWQITRRRYEGGLANHMQVLVAEDIYLALNRDLTELRARRVQLDVSLVRALGGGYQREAS
jgi:NodT family efflux transporter outer membrane factor (OMF) lipoprotein